MGPVDGPKDDAFHCDKGKDRFSLLFGSKYSIGLAMKPKQLVKRVVDSEEHLVGASSNGLHVPPVHRRRTLNGVLSRRTSKESGYSTSNNNQSQQLQSHSILTRAKTTSQNGGRLGSFSSFMFPTLSSESSKLGCTVNEPQNS